MSIQPIVKVSLRPVQVPVVEDKVQSKFNTEVGTALRELANSPFGSGIWLEDVTVGIAETVVPHKLGKKPRGYIVMAKDSPGDVYFTQAPTASNLYFEANFAVTVDLWVF